ncbi:MAG: adenylate/guanylate cyclase domain-containing protein [Ferruginibacter sp.]
MKKILSLLFMLCLLQHSSFSQDQRAVDSLQNELKKLQATKLKSGSNYPKMNDTLIANILNNLSASYWGSNPDKAMDYANQTLALSEQIGYKKGIGRAYNSMGVINDNKGDNLQALEFYKKALAIFEDIAFKKGISSCYNNIGVIYYNQSNYPEALMNYFAASKIYEEIGDKFGLASGYTNIGNIYYNQGNYPEGLKMQFAALKIFVEIDNKNGQGFAYNNIALIYFSQGNYTEALKNQFTALKFYEEIGNKPLIAMCYNNLGGIYEKQGKYPEGLKNHFASLKIMEELENKKGMAMSYNNIGVIYNSQGNYPGALKQYFAGLKIYEEIGDKEGVALSYNNIGANLIKQKKYIDASQYVNKGLLISKEIGNTEDIKESYRNLAGLDSAQGNYKQSLEHYKLYISYRDSLFNEENTKKLVQSLMQFDFDKKESIAKAEQEKKDAVALKELQKQKLVRNGFVGGFTIVLLFAGVFFIQRNKIMKGKKRSDELLLNILPSEVAEELKLKGSAEAKQFDDVTVLFTDFKDFTQISEKLKPDELVAEIHYCFKAFDNIITRHGIEKIKTVGDAYLCAGGLPTLNHTHAFDVVAAALEIKNLILTRKREKEAKGEIAFEIRVGIHTGPVVAGIVGIKKFSYDIWGDTVNTAARMESSCEPGHVNISGSTYELIKDRFQCTYRGKIDAKHKGEIDMYFVDGVL